MFAKKIRRDSVSAYAANAAFFILVSFFPFLILMISAVRLIFPNGVPISTSALTGSTNLLWIYLSEILKEAENVAAGTVLSLAVVSALWAASKGLFALMRGLNTIDGTDETRSYFTTRTLAIVYTLGLIVTLILTFVLLVLGNRIYHFISANIPALEQIDGLVSMMRYIFGAVVLTSFFTILYTFVPNHRSKIRYELPGAVCSTAGWLGFSAIYSIYIDSFNGFSIYGSLSSVVLLMLWLYFCMYILLVGAEINNIVRTLIEERKK